MDQRFPAWPRGHHTRIGLWFVVIIVVSIGLLEACGSGSFSSTTKVESSIELDDCQLSTTGSAISYKAKCGRLAVYEDRASNRGKKIDLNIAVIPAVSRNPEPDPIFFLAGGPGEAATEAFIGLLGAFNRLNQKRDIVLVDQRGTGKSNPLHCPSDDSESPDVEADQWAPYLQECLRKLDGDPTLYQTSIAMEDLDQVREALGYPRINLYGASYGTRAALVYLKAYPNFVRTVILDGVAPLNWSIGPGIAAAGQNSLELTFERCNREIDCRERMESNNVELMKKFTSVMQKLDMEKVELMLPHPFSGEPTTVIFTAQIFANTVHFMSYAPETASLIPLMIDEAYQRNDFTMAAAQYLSSSALVESSISSGMRYSILCAEDVPFYEQQLTTDGYLSDYITDNFMTICKTWPRGDVPEDFKEPVFSQIPILLISGEADPVTPPENAEMAMQTLPNSLHLVALGMGHINIFRGCIPKIATEFVETGNVIGFDITCVENIKPMPFFINFSGPVP